MARRNPAVAVLALGAVMSGLAGAQPPASEDVSWYYDAETALQVARRTERPIVLLKIRADIGPDVKT
jgi:hypothetical protein